MIIDFRNEHSQITEHEIKRWSEVGVKTILFTLHHPYQFDDKNLEVLLEKTKTIHDHGLKAGIYTGLLGIEKDSTISEFSIWLSDFHQRTINGNVVYYHPHKEKTWGKMFCPNSGYISFKMPFWKKAIETLDLDVVFFDLPWFRSGGRKKI